MREEISQTAYVLRCAKCGSFYDAAELAGAVFFSDKKSLRAPELKTPCTDCGEGKYEIRKVVVT